MRVAVLGKGNIGGTLGVKWERAGHEVAYGVRDPEKHEGGSVLAVAAALKDAQVALFAVPSSAVEPLARHHARLLDGLILIDATNDLAGVQMSRVDEPQKHAPRARVYRAFNSLGWEVFANPKFDGMRADLFYCGPEADGAARSVERLIEDVGLRPIRIGGLEQVDLIDGLVRLWFATAVNGGRGRHTAFKMLTD